MNRRLFTQMAGLAVALHIAAGASGANFIPLGLDVLDFGQLSSNGEWLVATERTKPQPPCIDSADCGPVLNALRWSKSTGLEPLLDFDRGNAISNDGRFIVGTRRKTEGSGPFAWVEGQGVMDFGEVEGIADIGYATDISSDGSFAVGGLGQHYFATHYFGGSPEAFLWSADSGMMRLGDLEGGKRRSFATAVSEDGSVVVGEATSTRSPRGEAFIWTPDEGMRGLEEVVGLVQSTATNVSSNSEVVIGYGWGGDGPTQTRRGFRYQTSGNVTELNFSPLATDEEGEVIVGTSNGTAMIWSTSLGSQILRDYVAREYGLTSELEGWTLDTARDVSDDGSVIVGFGTNPGGQREAWILVIPEPSSLFLFIFCLSVLRLRRPA